MGNERSLTKSEWTALHTLSVLRKMLLVPHEPHDYVNMGDIKRVDVQREQTSGVCRDVRERTITYGWGKGWRFVSITLQKEERCRDTEEFPALSDDKPYPWNVVRIEIRGKAFRTKEEGVILFSDEASVALIGEHSRPPVPHYSFY